MSEFDRQMAREALQRGNNKEARRILRPLVHESPDDWTLWWQLALATDEVEQKITCIKQVLRLNPDHGDAAMLLRQIERKIARPTPVSGVRRPVHDDRQEIDKRAAMPNTGKLEVSWSAKRTNFSLMPAIATGITGAILALIIGLVYVLVSPAQRLPQATAAPIRALTISVDSCVLEGGDIAALTFKNQAGTTINLASGESGAETELFILDAGSEYLIEVKPDDPVRYLAASNDEINAGGAVITVPAGSSCIVVIN